MPSTHRLRTAQESSNPYSKAKEPRPSSSPVLRQRTSSVLLSSPSTPCRPSTPAAAHGKTRVRQRPVLPDSQTHRQTHTQIHRRTHSPASKIQSTTCSGGRSPGTALTLTDGWPCRCSGMTLHSLRLVLKPTLPNSTWHRCQQQSPRQQQQQQQHLRRTPAVLLKALKWPDRQCVSLEKRATHTAGRGLSQPPWSAIPSYNWGQLC